MNYFNGCQTDGKTWVALGQQESKDACQEFCANKEGCQAWTWHDANQGSWAKVCVGRMDGFYTDKEEGGHYSGRLNSTSQSSSTGAAGGVEVASVTLVASEGSLVV